MGVYYSYGANRFTVKLHSLTLKGQPFSRPGPGIAIHRFVLGVADSEFCDELSTECRVRGADDEMYHAEIIEETLNSYTVRYDNNDKNRKADIADKSDFIDITDKSDKRTIHLESSRWAVVRFPCDCEFGKWLKSKRKVQRLNILRKRVKNKRGLMKRAAEAEIEETTKGRTYCSKCEMTGCIQPTEEERKESDSDQSIDSRSMQRSDGEAESTNMVALLIVMCSQKAFKDNWPEDSDSSNDEPKTICDAFYHTIHTLFGFPTSNAAIDLDDAKVPIRVEPAKAFFDPSGKEIPEKRRRLKGRVLTGQPLTDRILREEERIRRMN